MSDINKDDKAVFLQKLWQYRRQFEYMIPAAMVFIAGGMKMGWSLYELPSAQYDNNIDSNFLTILWLIGIILGVCMASCYAGHMTKNISHTLSGFLLIVGGIFFICMPTTFVAIAFSCISEGAAFGLLQLQAFVTGAEVANKDIRGLLMSSERCFIWLGILLQLTFTYMWYAFEPTTGHTMHVDQLHGFVVSCLGITTIIWTFKLRTESPLLLLKLQQEEAAVTALNKLQGTHLTNAELTRMRADYVQLLS